MNVSSNWSGENMVMIIPGWDIHKEDVKLSSIDNFKHTTLGVYWQEL